MYRLIPLIILSLLFSCSPKQENIEAKKKLLENQDITPYNPPVKSLDINLSDLKSNKKQAIGKVLETPYLYLSQKIKAHKSKTYAKLTYSRAKKVEIAKYEKIKPKKDKGASDRVLPSIKKNIISLSENIYIEHDKGNNFKVVLDNSMGYKKDIRWINKILYINDDSDKFTMRKSENNEHLKTLNEPSQLLSKVLEMISYRITASYKDNKDYNGRDVLVFEFKSLDEPYKKFEMKSKSEIKDITGSIYIDQATYSPIFIDLEINWSFKSKVKNKLTNEPELIDAQFIIKRNTTSIGDESIDIKTPEQEKVLNVKIAPSEADAEEKILNFKKGHSSLDKLRKEKKERDKLLGITK